MPALEDSTIAATLSVRERLMEHRANAACAVCHDIMDPVGFALENFDAIGRWRDEDSGVPIDASGELPDGSRFNGPRELSELMATVRFAMAGRVAIGMCSPA